jgi:anaerobic magnesium-protoporphyrin IX monomethyl ester cyclase
MRIMLINPPYQTLTSNLGVGHQVPLGLLMVGGALIDAGHTVRLIDAECHHLPMRQIVRLVCNWRAEVVMTGHAGSTPAHPVCMKMLREIKRACPGVMTVYGGVFPTYHARPILTDGPAVDVVVRGEGEATAVELAAALEQARAGGEDAAALTRVRGIAFRRGGQVVVTPDRPPIPNLDQYRVGWELIRRWDDYRCFGLGRAAIVQFSRGCPHRCTYCGQHGFWVKWRHRDPVRLADEIEWLHRTHHIRFITLADENPTTLRAPWRRFLHELARRRLPVHLFATIRATDIVRDADLLPLYRRAGILYVLMGIESTDDAVLRQIGKNSTQRHDVEACRLLRRNGIHSILGHIVGFEDETWQTFRATMRDLRRYQGDYLNAMYVTPHDWTVFGTEVEGRPLVQPNQRWWDYRHQVLAQRHLKPWQLFAAVKWLELWFHLRPDRLRRMLRAADPFAVRQLLWCSLHTGLVWLGEIVEHFVAARPRGIRRPNRAVRLPVWMAPPDEARSTEPAPGHHRPPADPPAPGSGCGVVLGPRQRGPEAVQSSGSMHIRRAVRAESQA